MARGKNKWITIIVIWLVFGFIRNPVEDYLRRELTESKVLLPLPGRNSVTVLSQSVLMGTLGGLRSVLSSFLILESYHHFSEQNWDENRQALVMATYLEPTEESHWVDLVWHRGINATAWVEYHSNLPDLERRLRFNEYTLDAIKLGETGLQQIPDAVDLRLQLVEVYKEKLKDPVGTSRIYGELMNLEGAPAYATRFFGYFLADCPGKEREAYEHLIKLYREGKHHHKPTLIKRILLLEEKLNIPSPLWIPENDPDTHPEMRKPMKSQLRKLPGGLRIP